MTKKNTLSDKHRAEFHASGISDGLIAQYDITSRKKSKRAHPGWQIIYPDTGYYRFKPDTPYGSARKAWQ